MIRKDFELGVILGLCLPPMIRDTRPDPVPPEEEETVTDAAEAAVLGVGVLGQMKLGGNG